MNLCRYRCYVQQYCYHSKTSFPPRKTFSLVLCSDFSAKMQSSSDKAAATVESKLVILAPSRLAVTSCICSSSSSGASKGSQ